MKKIISMITVVFTIGLIWSSALAGGPKKINKCMTISKSGSYIVVKNLRASARTNGNCITIHADFVTLDLNGFTLTGLGNDTGYGVSDYGYIVRQGIVVRNGKVTKFSTGIRLYGCMGAIIENISAVSNDQNGIETGLFNIVRGSTAVGNKLNGISIGSGSLATGNTAAQNENGMYFDCPCNVIGNTAFNNTSSNYDFDNADGNCLFSNNLFP